MSRQYTDDHTVRKERKFLISSSLSQSLTVLSVIVLIILIDQKCQVQKQLKLILRNCRMVRYTINVGAFILPYILLSIRI
jgi:hypothetical protein